MANDLVTYESVISQIYIEVRDRLKAVEGITTVARWNNQLDNEKMEYAVVLPAVYIELLPIEWTYAHWERRRGPITFRLHRCLQANSMNFETQDWEFNQLCHQNMQGFEGECFSAFVNTQETINHNYDTWIDNMADYRTFVDDETLLKLRNTGSVSKMTITVEEE